MATGFGPNNSIPYEFRPPWFTGEDAIYDLDDNDLFGWGAIDRLAAYDPLLYFHPF